MVAKILAYEKGDVAAPWRRQAFFAADNDEPGFAGQAGALARVLSGYDSRVVTVDKDGAARASLLEGVWGWHGADILFRTRQPELVGSGERFSAWRM